MIPKTIALLAILLASCVSIDSGSSIAPNKVKLSEVQGCYYDEHSTTYSSNNSTYLTCRKLCINGDSVYMSYNLYIGTLSDDSSDYAISIVDESEENSSKILELDPDIDGVYVNNFKIIDGMYNGYYVIHEINDERVIEAGSWQQFSENGWKLCLL